MKLVDLHVHSTCSDGTLTPSELVSLAKKTDHADEKEVCCEKQL